MTITRPTCIPFFIFCVCSFSTDADRRPRYITTPPQNVALLPGESTQLTCVSNTSIAADWVVTPIGQSSAAVVRGCQVNPIYADIYDVVQDGPGSCNLVVRSATIDLAGLYVCQESSGFDPPQSAQLVLLNSDPQCTVLFNYGNTTDVAENEVIQLTCTAVYTTNLSPLDTLWFDPVGHPVVPTTDTTPDGTYQSYIEFTAPPNLVGSYSALTYFLPPANPPSTATNTPDYSHSWIFPVIQVLYCPNNITVLNNNEPFDEEDVSVGDNLTCYSNGSPDPVYFWIDVSTDQRTEGQSFVVPATGNFTFYCTAYTFFRGNECNISIELSGIALVMRIYPQNTAVVTGITDRLGCRYGLAELSWIFTAPASPGIVIAINCQVLSSLTVYFDVDRSTGGCDLIVLTVNASHAGVYACQESESPLRPPTAELLVLNSDPVCSDDVMPDGIVLSGQKVRISCTMNYVGYSGNIIPTMSFYNSVDNEQITNATNASTAGQVSFYIDMTVYPETFPSFTVRTFFPVPSIPDTATSIPATNPPMYTSTWNSTERTVYYCPTEISVSPSSNDIYLGDILTCSANGFPMPSFRWTDLETSTSIDGPTLNLTSIGLFSYACTAYNTIRTSTCNISTTVDINVFGYVAPGNIAIESGVNVTLTCTQRNQEIAWLFSAVGSITSVSVAINCNVLAIYNNKYLVDKSNNNCDLIALNVDSSHAGTYTCQDPYSTDIPPSSMLIVLDSTPDCFVNLTGECDTRISCNVTYTGHLTPMMSWTDQDGHPVTNATYFYDGNEVYSYVDVSASYTSVLESLTCTTYFDVPPTVPPNSQTDPAANAPDYSDVYQSPTILFNLTFPDSCPILVQQSSLTFADAYFFNRSWDEFVAGFGDEGINSGYWIGLEKLHTITSNDGNCTAHFDLLERGTNEWYWAEYSQFAVDDSSTDYILHVTGYSGNTQDIMQNHDQQPFTAYDHGPFPFCAQSYYGGFWYYFACYYAGINCAPGSNFWWFDVSIPESGYYRYLQISRLWLLC